jgi:hypothetical protein
VVFRLVLAYLGITLECPNTGGYLDKIGLSKQY